jgi:hypothetical protein
VADQPQWGSYEDVTREIVDRLARAAGVQTTRLERNVVMQGCATVNQIDVLWEFVDANGSPGRIVFECRSYATAVKQQALHSWRSVVDDITVDGVATVGVMVTTTGYQSGAQRVAETYGVVILELREPNEADTADRVWEINVELRLRFPRIVDFRLDAVEVFSDQREVRVLGSDIMIEDGQGGQEHALDVVLAGELNPMHGPPTPFHEVVRQFEPPRVVFVEGTPVARVGAIAATVGEVEGDPFEFRVGGLENVAWMLKDTLTGARVWFADDGRVWSTDA